MASQIKILSTVFAMLLSSSAFADLAIIANPGYNDGELDTHSIRRIFLGERKAFPDGHRATPINHNAGSPDRKVFFNTVLSMDESSHKRHWKHKTTTGIGYAPVEVSSHKAVLDKVAHTDGAISYIDARLVNDSVKVLLIVNN